MSRPPVKPVEERLRVVLAVLRGEVSIKAAARRERVSETRSLPGGTSSWTAAARRWPAAPAMAQHPGAGPTGPGRGADQRPRRSPRGGAGVAQGGRLADAGLSVTRMCQLLGMPMACWYRWRAVVGAARPRPGKGPWPAPVVDQIEPLAAKHAEQGQPGPPQDLGAADRRRRPSQPVLGATGLARRAWCSRSATRPSAASSLRPAGRCSWTSDRPNRVWRTDFSELESLTGGIWPMSGWSRTGPRPAWPAR